ncbi:DNA polymerase III subunit alpha [Lutimonas saemankumensis]|uniref:DNA polymerase III subunit alpha n=1 Tax=Lutimonas saemankumensis TaxID=483016 RepID=UPI001CD2304C|nr:DNA polymerase III subunit alpha [Lutimonas saemankumensis]MCA0932354.1 DNA polymerase III subunit alpha [Lutimonas saemankumensis]
MYLNTHTYYSLRYGTIKPEELLQLAQHKGLKYFALTDINSTTACIDFVRLSSKYGISPVLGVDFRNGVQQEFVLLAQSNKGFRYINEFLSSLLHQKKFYVAEEPPILPEVFVIYPFSKQLKRPLNHNEFLGIRPEELPKLKFTRSVWPMEKLVILQTVSFQNKKGFNTHRLLRAIDNNTLLSKLPLSEQGKETDIMLSFKELNEVYKDYPQLIQNTQRVLEQCHISFDFENQVPKNQKTYTQNEDLDFRLMRKLAYQGLKYRYKKLGSRIFNRLEKELEIIQQKQFVSYFLINWKILKYARSKGYYYVGRGSGANSIVAYLLRITDVDPIELDLYFERFINLYRKNPPDFDIDFSWRDRDDITNFIFKTFKNTALISVYNTFKFRASVRELGKVFGLPKEEIDKLSKRQFHIDQLDFLSKLVIAYSQFIEGFPNYLGIHAGGILISERPISHYTATFLPPKGFSTTMFDMVVAEDIGLYKFDILSQRGLGKIKEAVEIVKYNRPEIPPIDIHDIKRFKEDKKIKYLLKNAKAIGCFYVESPAMRMLLKKLQVDNYLGLVAASSVIRPGVSKSGMMREYILRYRHPEKRKDAHPILLKIMPETYGVMVYQEDVIKVAHYFGGLTLGEADMLRRGMSGKFRSREEFLKVKNQFFENCRQKGHSYELTAEIWRQIESFAGYAFAKGHSASYAVESYQSLFLKAYYPLEYMVATVNNFGGFYRVDLYLHEARMHGAVIHPPDINKSNYETRIEGKHIYLGFILLHSFEVANARRIVAERERKGIYTDLDDFIERVPISIEQISVLIKINAFAFTGRNKRELLWEAYMKINKVNLEEQVVTLFKTEKICYRTPDLPSSKYEDAFDEIEYLGFPLCDPFELITNKIDSYIQAKELPEHIHKTVITYGYYVTAKNTSTHKGDRMYFGTFLDRNGDYIDTVHFPPVARKFPFRGKGVYQLIGKVMEEFDSISIEISSMKKLDMMQDPRYAEEQNKQIIT